MYGHVITKFSRMGRLLHLLTHGALRESSAIKRVTMGRVDFSCQHEFNLATSQLDDNANLRCRITDVDDLQQLNDHIRCKFPSTLIA